MRDQTGYGRCRKYDGVVAVRGDWTVGAGFRRGAGALRLLAAEQMAARNEKIGQRAGYEQAMRVLIEPLIANLGKAKHPFDDADRWQKARPDRRRRNSLSPGCRAARSTGS
jgi:hypothetical protein